MRPISIILHRLFVFSVFRRGTLRHIYRCILFIFSCFMLQNKTEYEKPKHEQHYHHLGKESDLRLRTDCICIQVKTTALHCAHVDVSSRARDVIFV